MNDHNRIIYNCIGVQKILFNHQIRQQSIAILDTFQVKFLDSREVVAKKLNMYTQKTRPICIFSVIYVHLGIWEGD